MIDVKKRLLADLLGHVNKGIGSDMKSRYGRKDEEKDEVVDDSESEATEIPPAAKSSNRPDPTKDIEEIAKSIQQSDPIGTPGPVEAEEYHEPKTQEVTPDNVVEGIGVTADDPSDVKIEDLDDDELHRLLGRR